jgi:GNAT superfamily N-acetyltransferase
VGTLRLIPYPHGPHPEPGGNYEAPGEDAPVEASETFFRRPPPEYQVHRATSLHDGKEPYLKLGRLCVIEEFRGRKFANLLVQAALNWASENPHFWKEEVPEWKGLVFAHAQEPAIPLWQKNGFVTDEEVGSCDVVGIRHYGLFQRVNVRS